VSAISLEDYANQRSEVFLTQSSSRAEFAKRLNPQYAGPGYETPPVIFTIAGRVPDSRKAPLTPFMVIGDEELVSEPWPTRSTGPLPCAGAGGRIHSSRGRQTNIFFARRFP
jgi:hypothetical protein